jgi:very-short-patch-repair endonuclease
MSFESWLRTEGGVAHQVDVARAGFSRRVVDAAIAAGTARRLRRSWLAHHDAPAELIAAASAGGRLACVTAARHLGLWTFDEERLHLAVPPHAGHSDAADAVRHWGKGPVASHRYELVEPLPNVLAQVAACQPLERALVVWESAIRKNRTSLEVLRRIPMRGPRPRALIEACSVLSDSGIETVPALRLRRIGIQVRRQVRILGHRVDGLIGDRLIYQIDGFDFHREAAQRRKDVAHDRRLALAGYTVLRFDYAQVLFDWPAVEAEIRTALAQGLHLAS